MKNGWHGGLSPREVEDMGSADLYAYDQAVKMGHDTMNGIMNGDVAALALSRWLDGQPERTRVSILLGWTHGVIGRA
jgi:hypothetical protein